MQVNTLPIQISCYADGYVAFKRVANVPVLIDQPEQGVQAIISPLDIYIGADTEVKYGVRYPYKEMPELLSWIKAQQMEMPKFF